MDIWPTSCHESLHLNPLYDRLDAIRTAPTPSSLPPPPSLFPLPSQSSPTLSLDPQLPFSSSPSLNNGYPGILSLHNYRKFLSQDGDSPTFESHEGKTLRRKNAASNLHHHTNPMASGYYFPHLHHHHEHPFSVSSTASSPPPPLTPSYSPSALSEQLPELLDNFTFPLSPPREVDHHDDIVCDKQNPYKLLDTFRNRLEKFPDPDPPDIVPIRGHYRARSDSVLFRSRRARKPPTSASTATVIHHGTSFEILNPHDSLQFARIVSYIEDVDTQSILSNRRDSYLEMSSNDPIIIHEDVAMITSGLRDDTPDEIPTGYQQRAHEDLVGDSPHHTMPSISERLEERDAECCYPPSVRPLSRRLSMIRPWTAHNESDLGEPGPPICEEYIPLASRNGELNFAMYDIGYLPEPGKGTQNPTTIIYSQHKPLRKRPTLIRKKRKTISISETTTTLSTVSGPLRRLRGIANSLRRKTFPPRGGVASLS